MSILLRSLVVITVSALLLSGCATDMGPVAAYNGAIPVAAANGAIPVADAPVLQRGDKIKVSVYGEDNLNGVYDIDPSGSISLPLAGSVRAAGRTKLELQRDITRRYKSEYLQDPKVTVEIASFRPFYIMGEAEKPGEYPYRSGLNLLSAVTTAGGFTYRASRSTVLIQHFGENVWREYPLSSSIAIAPGDHIRIPERYF
jgi:polysaccharide export outer membrane protein